jgi:hypothetical protein
LPGGEVSWPGTPRTSLSQNIENRVEHCPSVNTPRSSTRFGRRQQVVQVLKLSAGQVTGIGFTHDALSALWWLLFAAYIE